MKYNLLVKYCRDGSDDTYEHEFAIPHEALAWTRSIVTRTPDEISSWFLTTGWDTGLPQVVARSLPA
jgi:hypothetical protein